MPSKFTSNIPDVLYLKELFTFKDNNIYWNYRPESHFATENKWELFNKKHCGNIAGSYGVRGYGMVTFDGYRYPIHKIAYAIQSNENINEIEIIDHIDGNPRNNNINNLRIATRSQNAINTKTRKNTVTGIKGVDYNKSSNRFRARVCINGTRYTKYYETLIDAVAGLYRLQKIHHGEFIRK